MKIKIIILFVSTFMIQTLFAQKTDPNVEILSLDSFLSNVAKGNHSFMAEKYNLNIAEAEAIAAKVMPDPELELEGANDNYKIGLGYQLELGNKRGARTRLAKSKTELEKLSLEYFYQELRAEAATEFFNATKEQKLLEIKQNSYEYMRKIYNYDSIRYNLGEVNQLDLRLSKLETSSLLNDLYEQEAVSKSALATINQYMGKSPLNNIDIKHNLDLQKEDYILANLIDRGLNNRIDLDMSKQAIEVANNQLRLTKAERKMDIGVSVGYEQEWKEYWPKSKSVKGGLTIPLMFSNRNKGAMNASKYEIEKSKIENQSNELQVETEISQAFFTFEAAKKKVKQYQTGLLEDAQKALEGTAYKYQKGESDITDVLVAQRTYNEFQEQYIESINNYFSSLVALQKACGVWKF